ncbi:MAG: hypothetical protein NZ529_04105 [Cytophagaceae bacterium]|nr:hypothetical protein [Cytophagaceae bacterium]MDW8455956.1 7TM diverse intracellular signaling domain-containing protein [Cytophagaceae bacterium]
MKYISGYIHAAEIFIINPSTVNAINIWKGKHTAYYIDKENKYSFREISSISFASKFQTPDKEMLVINNPNYSYWVKIDFLNQADEDYKFIFEIYDQTIDYAEVYIPTQKGYEKYVCGDKFPFYDRLYKHKNFAFNLYLPYNKPVSVYVKYVPGHSTTVVGAVKTNLVFISYALKEYFYLALFYGLVLSLIFYNFIMYVKMRLRYYILFVLYLLSVGLSMASNDGIGFHILWQNLPSFNNTFLHISSFILVATMLLFFLEFAKEIKFPMIVYTISFIFIGLRFLVMLYNLWNNGSLNISPIDLTIRLFLMICSIYAFMRGNRSIRYYMIGMVFLFFGYSVRELMSNGILGNNIFTVYMHLFCEALQMILISLAMSDRIQLTMQDINKKQKLALEQLAETNKETEKIKISLEQKLEQQIRAERYVSEGMQALSKVLTAHLNDPDVLYQNTLTFICKYFNMRLGTLYLVPFNSEKLVLRATYAVHDSEQILYEILPHEGLLGSLFSEPTSKIITNLPEDYYKISSGLGQSSPSVAYIEPLSFNNKLIGVFELAAFSEIKQEEYYLLKRCLEQIATTFNNVLSNEATQIMLKESREKEQQLLQQDQIMKQQIEELVTLKEEFERREKELLREIHLLKSAHK